MTKEAEAIQEPQAITSQELTYGDISNEKWREYEWTCPQTGKLARKRFNRPLRVAYRTGGSTHRVNIGEKTWTLVPAPGYLGCTVTWEGDKDCNW